MFDYILAVWLQLLYLTVAVEHCCSLFTWTYLTVVIEILYLIVCWCSSVFLTSNYWKARKQIFWQFFNFHIHPSFSLFVIMSGSYFSLSLPTLAPANFQKSIKHCVINNKENDSYLSLPFFSSRTPLFFWFFVEQVAGITGNNHLLPLRFATQRAWPGERQNETAIAHPPSRRCAIMLTATFAFLFWEGG